MYSTTALLCAVLVLAASPACRSQSELRPIVEHLGMLMWADEVSNFQVRVNKLPSRASRDTPTAFSLTSCTRR